jgi:hypothetical protein
MTTIFFRVVDAEDKAAALLAAIDAAGPAAQSVRFVAEPSSFSAIPRSPFAYWSTEEARQLFRRLPPFESNGRAARHGAATLDNFRFLRLSWETGQSPAFKDWRPYAKGGAYSPFYYDIHIVLNWIQSGKEVKAYVAAKVGSASRTIQATEFYFRPGLTWPSRTQSGFAPRILPRGCIFDAKGNTAFASGDDPIELLALLTILSSDVFAGLVHLQMTFGSFDVGVIQRTPVPQVSPSDLNALAPLAGTILLKK